MRVLVVGLGNRMFGDDGYGDLVAEKLEECGSRGFDVFHGAHLGLGMLGFLAGYDALVFIDIVEPGLAEAPPGSVRVFEVNPENADSEEYAELFSRATSAHSGSPAHLVAMLYSSGSFKGRAYIIGVVPASLDFSPRISPQLLEATPIVLEKLGRVLEKLGVRDYWVDEECVVKSVRRDAVLYEQP